MSDTFRPSTTYKGSEAPELFELKPRIRIEGLEPGAAEEESTCTPGAFPCRACCALSTERDSNTSLFTEVIEPVTSLFFWTP